MVVDACCWVRVRQVRGVGPGTGKIRDAGRWTTLLGSAPTIAVADAGARGRTRSVSICDEGWQIVVVYPVFVGGGG